MDETSDWRLCSAMAPYANCFCPNAQDVAIVSRAALWVYRTLMEPVVLEMRKRRKVAR